ncbi:MAG: hypothetical protein LBD49_03130 [Oscillospiraceae bacterium]|jgi:hypothetical protein|nr:hypothetical protein [Oscillospiraceae bacterium]
MIREYEMTREIFNKCSGNQMRDVFLEELELDDGKLDEFVRNYFAGKNISIERSDGGRGTTVFDIDISEQRQRLTFCEI